MTDNPIEKILKMTQKDLGDDPSMSIHAGGDLSVAAYVPYAIPSGIPELDLALGGKCGLPAGKMIEYFGFEMCGKTTAALMAIAECHKMGGIALFVDSEHSWSHRRAMELGVDLDRVQVADAYTIEAMFNVAERWLENVYSLGLDCPILIVFDSVTGVTTEHDQQQQITAEARVGQDAKQIRRGARRLQGLLARSKATAIMINHSIAKINAMGRGKQSQSAGGHGVKFFASVRVEFVSVGNLRDKDVRLGQKILLNIEKLKNARLTQSQIKELYLVEEGFDRKESLLNASMATGFVDHPKGSKIYTLWKDTEHQVQFAKNEWPEVISNHGGYDKIYEYWVHHGQETGQLDPWGDK